MTRFTSSLNGIKIPLFSAWRNYLLVILTAVFLLSAPIPSIAYFTNMKADVVVGQNNFSENSTGTTASKIKSISRGVFVDPKGRMIITDDQNHRVLIWNKVPKTNGVPADLVLGQPDFTSGTANNGGISASSLRNPTQTYSDGTKLFVTDIVNNRVLIWNTFPTQNQQAADVVVGQASFTATESTCNASTLFRPNGVTVYQNKLIVADKTQFRVLIWNPVPTTNGVAANLVLGQADFTTCSLQSSSNSSFNDPRSVQVDPSGRLYVSDNTASRIVIYNTFPTLNNQAFEVVVGQPNRTTWSAPSSTTASTIGGVLGFYTDGKRLIVPNASAKRVSIFNSIPTADNQAADLVLGQADFVSSSANGGESVSARGFGSPTDAFEFNNQLFISDEANARILIFPNTQNYPRLGISSIGSSPDSKTEGRLRVVGNMYVDNGLYDIWKVETSVNGGDYAAVASLDHSIQTNSTHDPGKTDTVQSSFFSDFEPWNYHNQPTGNGLKSDWLSNFNSMLSSKGYLLKVRGTNNNADSGFPLLYFLPFSLLSPTNSTNNPFSLTPISPLPTVSTANSGILPVLSSHPTLTFKVNPNFRGELKENIDKYEVWIQEFRTQNSNPRAEEGEWTKYIDSIPSDYDLVRDSELNHNQYSYDGTKDTGNGTYLTDSLKVIYTNNSSVIQVKKIGDQEGTTPKELSLSQGVYRLRITAVDKHGHTQDTEPVVAEIK